MLMVGGKTGRYDGTVSFFINVAHFLFSHEPHSRVKNPKIDRAQPTLQLHVGKQEPQVLARQICKQFGELEALRLDKELRV